MLYLVISRGLGEAIAEQLIAPDHHLICISRNKNDTLIAKSKNIDYFEFDLNNVDEIDLVIEKAFSKVNEQNAEGIYLINNAAVISQLGRIEQGSVKDFKNNLHVNLLAPILLTSSFIRNSHGMSVYSASKAGLDVFSQCVGVEQGKAASAVKVLSVWPGMIDTGLQEEARSVEKKIFESAEIFKMVKDRGMLATPAIVVEKIIELLLGDQFTQGSVIEELFA